MSAHAQLARRRDLARVIALLTDCVEYKRMRQRQGLLTDGGPGIRNLERKLGLAREALRTLDVELRAVGVQPVAEHDDAANPLGDILARLRQIPPTPAVWSALSFLVERLAQDATRANDSHPEWRDVPLHLAAATRDLLGFLIHVGFFARAPQAIIDGADAMVQSWGERSKLGTLWLAELCAVFELNMNPNLAPGAEFEPFPGKTDADRVGYVLRALRLNCRLKAAPLPLAFYRLTPHRLHEAEVVIRKALHKTKGRPPSSTTLARDFARAVGLNPPRLRDVNRPR